MVHSVVKMKINECIKQLRHFKHENNISIFEYQSEIVRPWKELKIKSSDWLNLIASCWLK